jgi:beta-glucanase (GH16 family)
VAGVLDLGAAFDPAENAGWPDCGEIDIMEHAGSQPTAVHGTIHGPGFAGLEHGIGQEHDTGVPLADDFHVYGVEWRPNHITWYLDGRPYLTRTPADTPRNRWPFSDDFFLLVNLAVSGDWPGNRNDDPDLPAALIIDWIRASDCTATIFR